MPDSEQGPSCEFDRRAAAHLSPCRGRLGEGVVTEPKTELVAGRGQVGPIGRKQRHDQLGAVDRCEQARCSVTGIQQAQAHRRLAHRMPQLGTVAEAIPMIDELTQQRDGFEGSTEPAPQRRL